MSKIVEWYCELPGFMRKPLWIFWHNFILSYDKETDLTLMNYGFEPLSGEHPKPKLYQVDEMERYSIQLYDYAVSHEPIQGKDVIEIGCGRGGGASYITRYLGVKSYMGVDLSQRGIDFCNKHHAVPNLRFVKGDALAVPAEDSSFDAVVNIESSRCYLSMERFLSEVKRILKPGGSFYFADMRRAEEMPDLLRQIAEAGFGTEKAIEITPNVVKALDMDADRRLTMIKERVPRPFLKNFNNFAGVKGTERYNAFASGAMQYWSFLLRSV